MTSMSRIGLSTVLAVTALIATACSSADTAYEESVLPLGQDSNCNKAEAKDTLVAQLVKDSLTSNYSLTRLSVAADGSIVGDNLPDILGGDLELINTVPEARDSVAQALVKVSGLPPYTVLSVGPDVAACDSVPAWTPEGQSLVATTSNSVWVAVENEKSWKTTHKEFGKQCALVKTVGNRDIVDPPGDGSTNEPVSTTVSATGVRANAWGLCGAAPVDSPCMLSYATGINYTGRSCRYYYGVLRCLTQ